MSLSILLDLKSSFSVLLFILLFLLFQLESIYFFFIVYASRKCLQTQHHKSYSTANIPCSEDGILHYFQYAYGLTMIGTRFIRSIQRQTNSAYSHLMVHFRDAKRLRGATVDYKYLQKISKEYSCYSYFITIVCSYQL